MYVSAMSATMTTAAMATIETVEIATGTTVPYPAAREPQTYGRYGACCS